MSHFRHCHFKSEPGRTKDILNQIGDQTFYLMGLDFFSSLKIKLTLKSEQESYELYLRCHWGG